MQALIWRLYKSFRDSGFGTVFYLGFACAKYNVP